MSGVIIAVAKNQNRQSPKNRQEDRWDIPYRIREIAVQAGLSERTVDRVLNKRGQVRESTAGRCSKPSPILTGNGRSYA